MSSHWQIKSAAPSTDALLNSPEDAHAYAKELGITEYTVKTHYACPVCAKSVRSNEHTFKGEINCDECDKQFKDLEQELEQELSQINPDRWQGFFFPK